jgi:hypothetical protein
VWEIEFESELFEPFLPSTLQTSEDVYGFELAEWLARRLAMRQIHTSYPQAEDWGWSIQYSLGGVVVLIGCRGVLPPLAEDGSSDVRRLLWTLFVKPLPSLKQRLNGARIADVQAPLISQIEVVLRSAGIRYQLAPGA